MPHVPNFRRGPRTWIAGLGLLAALPACAPDPGVGPSWFVETRDGRAPAFVHDAGARGALRMPEIMGSGAALLDHDGDGDLDLYLVNGAGPNRLLRHDPSGVLVDATAETGLGDNGYGMGVAVGDVDNDGDVDVYVTNVGADRLYANRGDGTFEDVTPRAGIAVNGWSTSAAFCDYDADGYLDLWVARYVDYDPARSCVDAAGRPDYCTPKEFPALADVLLHNEGDGTFRDASRTAGIAATRGAGLGVVCADLDGDARVDFYVANDLDPNRLWINRGDGSFEDRALLGGAAYNLEGLAESGMGVALGDLDDDGRLDLFVTHLTGQSNTLYRARAAGEFEDVTAGRGLALASLPLTGFGTAALDVELDGDLDLVVVNGGVFRGPRFEPVSTAPPWDDYAQPNQLFLNDGSGDFTMSDVAPALTRSAEVSRGLAVGDLDDDGDQDLLVTHTNGPARLYLGAAPRAGSWLTLRVIDPRLRRHAIGAEVTVVAGSRRRVSVVHRAHSYLSSSDPRVHFGLGRVAAVASVEVRWPDGLVEAFRIDGVDREVTLLRGAGGAGPVTRRVAGGWVAALFLIAPVGCGPGSQPGLVTAPPDVVVPAMEPAVRALLEQARHDVLERPDAHETWGAFGAALHAHRLFDAAEVCYRRAIELEPSEFRWAYLLAVTRDVEGADDEELIPLFERAAALRPDYAPLRVRLGHALSLRGRHAAAAAAFAEAMRLDPGSAAAWRGAGRTELALGRPDRARELLERAVAIDPGDGNAHAALALALQRSGAPEAAARVAARAAALPSSGGIADPIYQGEVVARGRSSSRALARATAALRAGDLDAALDDLRQVEQARPDDPRTQYLLGLVRLEHGDISQAQDHLSRALQLDPDHVEARVALARLHEAQGDLDAALRAYAAAVERAPQSDALRFKLGATLLRAGRVEAGLDVFRAVVLEQPDDPEAQFFLGQALERAGRTAAAADAYRAALALAPGHRSQQALDRLATGPR